MSPFLNICATIRVSCQLKKNGGIMDARKAWNNCLSWRRFFPLNKQWGGKIASNLKRDGASCPGWLHVNKDVLHKCSNSNIWSIKTYLCSLKVGRWIGNLDDRFKVIDEKPINGPFQLSINPTQPNSQVCFGMGRYGLAGWLIWNSLEILRPWFEILFYRIWPEK